MALIAGQRKFLGIIGRYQQSDDRRGLGFAGRVTLQPLSGGDNRDVLQDSGGLRFAGALGTSREQHIHVGPGQNEA